MHRTVTSLLLAGLLPGLFVRAHREPAISEFRIQATDYAFTAADSVPAGMVRVTLANVGKEPHHAQIIRLNNGVSIDQFNAAVAKAAADAQTQGDAAYMQLLSIAAPAGGPASLSPGKSGEVTLEMSPGQYVVVCFISSPDRHSHISKGMSRGFKVTAGAPTKPEPPKAAATITLSDFAFTPFPALKPGKVTLEVVNNGPEPHEMDVFRLKGITAQQLMTMLSGPPPAAAAGGPPPGPPPFEAIGGMQALMPKQKGWATLDLEPGDYAAVCLIPSPANQGKAHAALGMVTAFSVK